MAKVFQSMRVVLRTRRTKGKREDIESRLATLRSQFETRLLYDLR